MKKNFTSIIAVALLLLCVTTTHAQPPSLDQLIGNNKEYSSASLSKKTVYKPSKSKHFRWVNNSAWNHEINKEYKYNNRADLYETTNIKLGDSSYTKNVTLYDSKGIESGYENYSLINSIWILESGVRELRSYNAQGLLQQNVMEYYYMLTGDWIVIQQIDYTYDAEGHLLGSHSKDNIHWYTGDLSMQDHEKYYYTYDQNGRKETTIMEQYQLGQWVTINRASYKYNGTAVNEVTYDLWDSTDWKPIGRAIDMSWQVENEVYKSYTYQNWDGGTWLNNYRYSATYDNQGGYISTTQGWDGSTWIDGNRQTQIIDSYGNQTAYLEEEYDLGNNTWIKLYGNEQIHEYIGDTLVETIFKGLNFNTQSFENISKEEYSGFEEHTDLVEAEQANDILIYPNPAADILNINLGEGNKFSSLQLYDINGRVVTIQPVLANTFSLDISGYEAGVYFLQFRNDKSVETMRIIKQ